MKRSTFLLLMVFLPVICLGQNDIRTLSIQEHVDCWKRNARSVVFWQDTTCEGCKQIPFLGGMYDLQKAKTCLLTFDYYWINHASAGSISGMVIHLNLSKWPARGKEMTFDLPCSEIKSVNESFHPFPMPWGQVMGKVEIFRPLFGRWRIKADLGVLDIDGDVERIPAVSVKAKRMPHGYAKNIRPYERNI